MLPSRQRLASRATLLLAGATLVGALVLQACSRKQAGPDGSGTSTSASGSEPGLAGDPGELRFVDSAECAECHPHETAGWMGSHHDLAMQPATAETVLGDFADASFEHLGQQTRFFVRDGRFFANAEGPDGEQVDFEIAYVFGVEPLQQYLVEFPGGRMQCLTIAWDTLRERWFSLYPDQRFAPDDPLHWTGLYQNWNVMCADCHSTGLVKGYDVERNEYATTWHEIDVSCQACHGPGSAHVDWARRKLADPDLADLGPGAGLPAVLRRGMPTEQLDACARCHSRRAPLTPRFRHGEPFVEQFDPRRLDQDFYHADGQIEDEVYVWGSFVQSKMHHQGVACSDCHDPHSLELWVPGNAVCGQCHTTDAPLDRFSTLQAKAYDTPAHHHHPVGSEGALCVNCHMPERTYMVVDPRRDHSLRIPRPDLAAQLGTPDACTGCHADQGPEWAAERVAEWFGPRELPPHFATSFARARRGELSAQRGLEQIIADPEQSALVRATAVELLGALGVGELALLSALNDAQPLVRRSAVRGLEGLSSERVERALLAQLGDPSRPVRIELGRIMASLDPARLPEEMAADLARARADFRAAQEVGLDMPGANLNLAVDATLRGQPEEAMAWYQRALELDPWFLPARFNMANLLDGLGRTAEAEQVLSMGRSQFPEDGELAYSHGLVLAGLGRLEEAATALELAAQQLPGRARVRYNLGVVLNSLERFDAAEATWLEAANLAPEDLDIVSALVSLYAQRGSWQLARPWAQQLAKAGVPGTTELLERIESELR